MKIKYKIPAKLYSLDINSEKLVELSNEGSNFFYEALEVLDTKITKNKALLVYRGENKESLRNKLCFTNLDDLFHKFFHVGDKSKYLIKSNTFQRYLDDINDVSDKVFETIFDKINTKQKENNAKSEFKDYFTDIENKEDFLEKIIYLNDKSKLRMRDYYFSYLHQEEIDENKSSFFVSTSKDIEIAEDETFTGKGNNKIVIYYFISKPYTDRAIYSRNEPSLKRHCINNGLPTYNAPFYGEDEVCDLAAVAVISQQLFHESALLQCCAEQFNNGGIPVSFIAACLFAHSAQRTERSRTRHKCFKNFVGVSHSVAVAVDYPARRQLFAFTGILLDLAAL